jgi:chromosome segregation ATPase
VVLLIVTSTQGEHTSRAHKESTQGEHTFIEQSRPHIEVIQANTGPCNTCENFSELKSRDNIIQYIHELGKEIGSLKERYKFLEERKKDAEDKVELVQAQCHAELEKRTEELDVNWMKYLSRTQEENANALKEKDREIDVLRKENSQLSHAKFKVCLYICKW